MAADAGLLDQAEYVPDDASIAGARGTCANELTAELEVPVLPGTRITKPRPRTEVHIYAREPAEMNAALSQLTHDDINTALAGITADERAQGKWNRRMAVPGGLPHTLTAVWPTTTGAHDEAAAQRALSTPAFFGSAFAGGLPLDTILCHPNGDAGRQTFGASVKRAIVYNRGACRREVPLAKLLQDGNQMLVDRMQSEPFHGGIGSVKVTYSIFQSMLGATPGAGAPKSELYWLFHYVARDLTGLAPSDVWGAVRYDFVVDGGRVIVEPHEIRWNYNGAWGPLSSNGAVYQEGWRPATTTQGGTMVKTINAQLQERQLLAPQNSLLTAALSGYDCNDDNFLDRCGGAASDVVATIVKPLRTQRWPKFSSAEMSRLLCAIGDKVGCDAIGANVADVLRKRWVCTTSSISPDRRYCDMVIPATRLVAMPDSVGIVFFDSDDFDNAAYAIQAATSQLCELDGAVPAQRSFVANVIATE